MLRTLVGEDNTHVAALGLNRQHVECTYCTLVSAYHALFRVIVRNPHHVLHPLLPPRKRTVYNLRKFTHGLTIPRTSQF